MENLTVTAALTELTAVVKSIMGIIAADGLLFTLWCASLFFIGIGAVKAIKKAAKK